MEGEMWRGLTVRGKSGEKGNPFFFSDARREAVRQLPTAGADDLLR